MKKQPDWTWPNGKRIAVVFNVCLEAWSDGKAPGISPMGNPLPAGVLDTMAISWAAYGVEVGIHRLMEGFRAPRRQGERDDQRRHRRAHSRNRQGDRRQRSRSAVAFLRHGRDPGALVRRRRRAKTSSAARRFCEKHQDEKIVGWLSPRGTSKPTTPKLLAEAGYRWYGDVFDTDLPYVANHGNKQIVAIPLSYDVNDMPSMKYGHPPRMMLDSFNEVIDIARARRQ